MFFNERGNMASHKYTNEELVEAFIANDFNISAAAGSLGMTRQNFYYLQNKRPELAKQIDSAKEQRLDIAESELFKHVKNGNLDAIKFTLDRLGNNRGYGNKTNVNVSINNSEEILECIKAKTNNFNKVVGDGETIDI